MSLRRKIIVIFPLLLSLMACKVATNTIEAFEFWGSQVAPMFFITLEDRCMEDGGIWIIDEGTGEGECERTYYGVTLPSESESSEADAESEPVDEIESDQSNEADTSVPEGTYVGTTTLPDYWNNNQPWLGTIPQNEITIIVDNGGHVSGAMIVIGKGYQSEPIDGCVSRFNLYTEANLEGRLIITKGAIDLHMTRTEEIWRSGCPSATERSIESGTVQAQILIIDNKVIKGAVPNYFSFEATKR